MKPRNFPKLALPLIAAASIAASAHAQDKKSSNIADEVGRTTPASEAAETLTLAYRLSDYARATKDARAMILAGRMLDSVAVRSPDGASKTGQPPASPALYAEAAQFAAGDPQLLAEVEAARAETTRGTGCGPSPRCAIFLVETVAPGVSWRLRMPARGGETVVVGARRDGATRMDLKLFDENENLVCQDLSQNMTMYCRFSPIWTGPFAVVITNRGDQSVAVKVVTN